MTSAMANQRSGATPPIPSAERRQAKQSLRRYVDIILFKSYAELQSERQRTYLGFVWWILEPLMFMGTMWFVFGYLLARGTEDYPVFLLTGLVFWQWFKSCISHGSVAVLQGNPLIQLVVLPPVIFPLVNVLTDSFKFVFILALLIGLLLLTGHAQSPTLLALPLVLLAELAVICVFTIWISAAVPFFPDLRFVTENVLIAMMFVSGIFFDASALPNSVQEYFYWNPAAFLIREARNVLMYQQWPDFAGLILLTVGAILLCLAGGLLLERMRKFYPKLPR